MKKDNLFGLCKKCGNNIYLSSEDQTIFHTRNGGIFEVSHTWIEDKLCKKRDASWFLFSEQINIIESSDIFIDWCYKDTYSQRDIRKLALFLKYKPFLISKILKENGGIK